MHRFRFFSVVKYDLANKNHIGIMVILCIHNWYLNYHSKSEVDLLDMANIASYLLNINFRPVQQYLSSENPEICINFSHLYMENELSKKCIAILKWQYTKHKTDLQLFLSLGKSALKCSFPLLTLSDPLYWKQRIHRYPVDYNWTVTINWESTKAIISFAG